MERRRYLATVASGAIPLIAGCGSSETDSSGSSGDESTPEPADESTPSATPTETEAETLTETPTESPTPIPEPDPVQISGSGGDVSDTFETIGGFVSFTFKHEGESNFQVELLDGNGDTVEYLVNAIGDYDGRAGKYLPEGEYLLDITADGDWSGAVEQPRFTNADVEAPPVSASGSQADWIGPIDFEGAVKVAVKASGEGNLALWAATINGERVSLLSNDIAPFEDTSVVSEDGHGLLLVDTDRADWEIEVSN